MEMNEYYILTTMADTITELPIGYQAGGYSFYLYPPSLGTMLLLSRAVSKHLNCSNIYHEYIVQNKDLMIEMLAICSFSRREQACKLSNLHRQIVKLQKAEIEELAPIFSMLSEWDKDLERFQKYFQLDIEHKYISKANHIKENGNSYLFNGKSIYGTLIDVACERYGWTMYYVVWGISLLNLNLLLQDKVVNIFLTDEEKRKAAIPKDRNCIKMDKNTNIQQILSLLKK